MFILVLYLKNTFWKLNQRWKYVWKGLRMPVCEECWCVWNAELNWPDLWGSISPNLNPSWFPPPLQTINGKLPQSQTQRGGGYGVRGRAGDTFISEVKNNSLLQVYHLFLCWAPRRTYVCKEMSGCRCTCSSAYCCFYSSSCPYLNFCSYFSNCLCCSSFLKPFFRSLGPCSPLLFVVLAIFIVVLPALKVFFVFFFVEMIVFTIFSISILHIYCSF